MTDKLPSFTKLPSGWIEEGGLRTFRWAPSGSDNLAALMVLIAIAHHIDLESGDARLTYDHIAQATSLSRSKVSAALRVLSDHEIIKLTPNGRSSYALTNYDPSLGYALLPARGLYQNGMIDAFTEFRLRRRAELDAMKLYLTFAARRSRETNMAHITYDQIEEYCDVPRSSIRPALTVLGANGLVHVERLPSDMSKYGVANAYRLVHLNPRRHMGTIGRSADFGAGPFADL